jgi:diguanylate cyclase (GGDEF)-like protein
MGLAPAGQGLPGGALPPGREAPCAISLLPAVLMAWTNEMAGPTGNGSPPGKQPSGPAARPSGGRAIPHQVERDDAPASAEGSTAEGNLESRGSGRGAPTPVSSQPVGSAGGGPTGSFGPPTARADAALDGTLASYLERVANRTAAAFGVQAVAIALVGDDRRCFVGGIAPPLWLTRDPGALIRSRACATVLESGEPIAVSDATTAAGSSGSAAKTLRVPAYMIAPLPRGANDRPTGVLCVFATEPRTWSSEEVRALVEHAAATAPALALRRRPSLGDRTVQRTRREGLHDPLTGLPNRVLFMERLAQAIARNRREPAPFAVILLDLDHFRTINESLGHAAGDTLLIAVAQRLLDCARAGDTAARLGADEFAILVHRVTHAADAARIAERVKEGLTAAIDVDGYEVYTSASFGIALEAGGAGEPEHLLRSADLALGSAKRAGRARFVVFDRVMHAEAVERLHLETELRAAAARDAFVLHYQPIISLATGRIVSVEALVRWDHAERGLVPPAAFIAAAEATGIIVSVGEWVMTEACRQLHAWHEIHPEWKGLSMSVNVSVRQLLRPDFVDMVTRVVRECGIPPQCLILELTESVIVERPDLILAALTMLRRTGVRVHLDDFGTGYSSLAVLDRLPLDGVKIDRTFVQMLGREARATQFVRAMATLAQSLRLETVGEGVSTDAQLRELRALGCTFAQGHLFAAAGEAVVVDRLLTTNPTW